MFDAEVHAGPIELDGQRYVLAASRDISGRKELERHLDELNRSLEDRVSQAVAEVRAKDQMLINQGRLAAMGEMIGNIAHQWRQPLNALGLVLQNLVDAARFGELDAATLDDAVKTSKRLIHGMSTTIEVFRNFFRPAKAESTFSALEQIRATVGLLEASFSSSGISLEVDAAADVTLRGVANEYAQVLINLLTNARQALQAGVVHSAYIRVRLEERDGLACVTVRDNGGGIEDTILPRVFEPYFSTKPDGTGLGLYICHQIAVQSFGGRLEARNVDGGAEFTMWTPLASDGRDEPAEGRSH